MISEHIDEYGSSHISCPMCAWQPCRHSQHATCRRCQRSILRGARWRDGYHWWHIAEDHSLRRGCRAASFTTENGWDDSIDRKWMARPA
jgi:hypothetical protein